ncbi:MAG: hypothetical protein LBK60_01260 [Verrucomicrobiales bacterium]|jgi:hypothetical protein|nr:hypothetical protein [Verrucomicrobiales bacterium]
MAGITLTQANYPNCIKEGLTQPILTLSDHQSSSIRFENNLPAPGKFDQIQIDGCVFGAQDQHLRCDWLLRFNCAEQRHEIYVELKGKNIRHAARQLGETIRLISSEALRHCYIVYTSNPLTSSELQTLKVRFQKNFNAHLKTVRDQSTVKLIKA